MIRANVQIKKSVENFQLRIKESIDFADKLARKGMIEQLAPDKALNTNIFTNSVDSIILDYRHGIETGINYLHQSKINKN